MRSSRRLTRASYVTPGPASVMIRPPIVMLTGPFSEARVARSVAESESLTAHILSTLSSSQGGHRSEAAFITFDPHSVCDVPADEFAGLVIRLAVPVREIE